MKRLLVTGASGFIGRHALITLREYDFEVHATSLHQQPEHTNRIRWHHVDLLDSGAIEKLVSAVRPTHLLHLAWYAAPHDYSESAQNLGWCEASIHLLGQFAKHAGERAVFAGSCFEYDLRYGFCSEDTTPCTPATLYGTCKNALQQVVSSFSARAGLSTAWGRLFYLYGPYENPQRLVPSVVRSLLRGQCARCTHGRQVRDFLHVEDAASAFVSLLCSDVNGIINIGSGQPVTVKRLIELAADLLGRRGLLRLGTRPMGPDEPYVVVADNRRMRSATGWNPRFSLEEGLRYTIEWWKRNQASGTCA